MDNTTIGQIEALMKANQAEKDRTPFLDVMYGALVTARDNGNWHLAAQAKAAAASAPASKPTTTAAAPAPAK